MRNFNYDDNEEFQPEIDNFFDEEDDEEYDGEEFFGEKSEIIRAMELELVESHINLKILQTAIKTCEKKWFWRFYSLPTKLKHIAKAYVTFERLLSEVEKEKKEE